MVSQPRRLLLPAYIALVCLAALATVALCVTLPLEPIEWAWWGAAALFLCILLGEAGRIELAQAAEEGSEVGRYVVSVSTIPHLVSILLLPPALAAGLAGAAMLVDELRAHSRGSRLAFNVSLTVFSVGTSGLAASVLGVAGRGLVQPEWWRVVAFFAVAATYHITNTWPVVVISAIASGGSLWRLIANNARYSTPAEFAVAVVGGLAAHEWVGGPSWMLAGIFPAIISHLALRSIGARHRKAEQIAALDRLGRAVSSAFTAEEVFAAAAAELRLALMAGSFVLFDQSARYLADGLAATPSGEARARELAERVRATGLPALSETSDWLVLPLGDGGTFGLIAQHAGAFGAEDRRYFSLVAERIAIALDNARRAADLERMAFHDSLTGLPNRALLLERLGTALAPSDARHGQVAVLFIDLDNFKLVNDSLGHEAGDELLLKVARRLQRATRPEDTLARLGGDEFVLLLEHVDGPEQALGAADTVATVLREPIELERRHVLMQASVGVAVSGAGRTVPTDLLRDADLALYKAKSSGKARSALFEPDLATAALRRLDLSNDLRRALDAGELRVFYQPLVEIAAGRLIGWEALVRWQHPRLGLVPPSDFIPVAEETGLIVPIGQWVLEEACRQVRLWRDEMGSAVTMNVNLSARQFQEPSLVDDIRRALAAAELDPSALHLEITESVVMQDVAAASATLAAISATGVKIAIDDFGTGYSSLAYLKRFPIETLKIDRSFVNGIVDDAQDAAIVSGIIALARTLNLTVTAEGIETVGQWARLQEMGCDFGQGYYFGKPIPAIPLEAQHAA